MPDMLDPVDVEEVEREICRLPDVEIVRIVADHAGRVTEVHVVAHGTKHPKQIARDVQSVALASFGIELDRRTISVVQLGDGDGEPEIDTATDADRADLRDGGSPRPSIERVTVQTAGVRADVTVGLRLGDHEAQGHAEGSVAAATRHRLVARAAIDALRALVPDADALDVDGAQILRVGSYDVAVVTLVHVATRSEQVLSGSAMVTRGHDTQAVVRAVLDATNRRLGAP